VLDHACLSTIATLTVIIWDIQVGGSVHFSLVVVLELDHIVLCSKACTQIKHIHESETFTIVLEWFFISIITV